MSSNKLEFNNLPTWLQELAGQEKTHEEQFNFEALTAMNNVLSVLDAFEQRRRALVSDYDCGELVMQLKAAAELIEYNMQWRKARMKEGDWS